MNKQVDVVVVGAVPVGPLLAIELKLGGAGVRVLERLTAPNLAAVSVDNDVEAALAGVKQLFMDERIRLPATVTSHSPAQGRVEVTLAPA